MLSLMLFDTEKSTEDPGLSAMIVLGNSENLAFSDHLRCFDACDYCPCGCERARALHGAPSACYVPMI